MIGEKFGRLTLLQRVQNNKHGQKMYEAICDCGQKGIFRLSSLTTGHTSSCGCLSGTKPENLIGHKIGRLTILARVEDQINPSGRKRKRVKCLCECGYEGVYLWENLLTRHTQSCGCIGLERTTTHGLSKTRINNIWRKMKNRCNNPNDEKYHRYGGRGIKVCDEWSDDFQSFYDWSIDNGYSEGLTIDRIDNDKGYNPDNCRWVPNSEQYGNKSSNRYIKINSEVKLLKEWLKQYQISPTTFYYRLKRGMNEVEALTKPKQNK